MSLSRVLVKEVMSPNVATIDFESAVFDACKTMAEKHIGSIVVTENNKPFGLFTERDLLHIIIRKEDLRKIKIKDHASKPLVVITPETSIFEAAKIMVEMHIRRLPVADNEGKLIGIFTSADLSTALAKSLNPETSP